MYLKFKYKKTLKKSQFQNSISYPMRQPCKKIGESFQISNFAPYIIHDAPSFQLSDTMSTSLPAPRSACLAVCHHETSKNTTRKMF